jgi:hypothetical protein
MREEMVGLGLWLDTSAQTPPQTMTAIIPRRPETIVG